jgi:thiol:disulfide interchange protein DsbD
MRIALMLHVALLAANFAKAQDPGDIVQWRAKTTSKSAVKAGQKLVAMLEAKIADGWHLYSITQAPGGPTRTEIIVPAKQAVKLGGYITGPLPESSFDPNFQMQTEFYVNSAGFEVPLLVESAAKPGPGQANIEVRFQACNDRICLPPAKARVPLALTIAR